MTRVFPFKSTGLNDPVLSYFLKHLCAWVTKLLTNRRACANKTVPMSLILDYFGKSLNTKTEVHSLLASSLENSEIPDQLASEKANLLGSTPLSTYQDLIVIK